MRRHEWLLIISISLVLIPQCCASTILATDAISANDDWAMFRRNPDHSGYADATNISGSFDLLWTFKTWKAVMSSPAVAEGYLVVGSRDWRIYCLNASDGKQLWNYSTGNEVNSSPAICSGSVYVGSEDGYVYRIEIGTGKLSWRSEVRGQVRSSPAVIGGCVYIGSGERDVFCLNASDGAPIWTFPTLRRVYSSPVVSEGVVYVATDDFFVYAVNASTGSARFAWMTIVLVFFTLAQTKLFWYILPAYPAFAIAIGNLLFQISKKLRASFLHVH